MCNQCSFFGIIKRRSKYASPLDLPMSLFSNTKYVYVAISNCDMAYLNNLLNGLSALGFNLIHIKNAITANMQNPDIHLAISAASESL